MPDILKRFILQIRDARIDLQISRPRWIVREFNDWTSTSTAGCWAQNGVVNIEIVRSAAGMTPTRSVPVKPSFRALSSSRRLS